MTRFGVQIKDVTEKKMSLSTFLWRPSNNYAINYIFKLKLGSLKSNEPCLVYGHAFPIGNLCPFFDYLMSKCLDMLIDKIKFITKPVSFVN